MAQVSEVLASQGWGPTIDPQNIFLKDWHSTTQLCVGIQHWEGSQASLLGKFKANEKRSVTKARQRRAPEGQLILKAAL